MTMANDGKANCLADKKSSQIENRKIMVKKDLLNKNHSLCLSLSRGLYFLLGNGHSGQLCVKF
jgi:hypothetical protein